MMEPWEIIEELAATSSRLDKLAILRKAAETGSIDFFAGAKYCYSVEISFGISEIANSKSYVKHSSVTWQDFEGILEKLNGRSLTGNAAMATLVEFRDRCTKEEWEGWYNRIIKRDLRCGVGAVVINRVVKELGKESNIYGYDIKLFGCQLAQDGGDAFQLQAPSFVEPKYDGYRVIATITKNKVELRSRNGKITTNFLHIEEFLYDLMKKQASLQPEEYRGGIVLDGEMISKNFQTLMKQINRKVDVDTRDCEYRVFDLLHMDEWRKGISTRSLRERKTFLAKALSGFGDNVPIKQVPSKMVDTQVGVELLMESAINQGYEGIMIKDVNGQYAHNRGPAWIKLKPVISVVLTVVGFENGTGRNKDRLGAILAEGEDNSFPGKFIRVKVGGGYSDRQRVEFWEKQKELLGQKVEVKADTISLSEGGQIYSLRFPRFNTFRDDLS